MKREKGPASLYENQMSDNSANCAWCVTCVHRAHVVVDGKDYGYGKCYCKKYPEDEDDPQVGKPDQVLFNYGDCPHYQKE